MRTDVARAVKRTPRREVREINNLPGAGVKAEITIPPFGEGFESGDGLEAVPRDANRSSSAVRIGKPDRITETSHDGSGTQINKSDEKAKVRRKKESAHDPKHTHEL